MKYGESVFDIFYLAAAIIAGILILRNSRIKNTAKQADTAKHIGSANLTGITRLTGIAVLILGCGDAFHLVPRVLNYFVDADFTAALGIGKLITSITMTVFYVLMYRIGCECYGVRERDIAYSAKEVSYPAIYILAAVRIIICLLPQNGWISNESSMLWGILRNVPFVILGAIVIRLYYRNRMKIKRFHNIWLWILLSFLFYIPVTVFAGVLPMLGMLMLPKTICYLAMIFIFYKASAADADII